ncbi:MAG: O-antigen ligase family protein [Flavobacteriales bacterium]
MLKFLREDWQFIALVFLWVAVAVFTGPIIYAFLPLSVFFMKSRDMWAELVFGFLIILVLSDITGEFVHMRVFKSAKNMYIAALAIIFLLERQRFVPFSQVFTIFLPFFIYSLFPLVFSNSMVVAVQKTLSYALMYLVVPNYVLYNFRRIGWPFFRNLMFFMAAILLAGWFAHYYGTFYSYVGGRFRGIFGNPNGMAIYCYLTIVLLTVLISLNRQLFSRNEKILLYGVIGFFLIYSGSRSSLTATMIFLLFNRFFARSPFLGFIGLVFFIGAAEVVSSNLEGIITALGLQEYFRLKTLEDGSGRYFAWAFAWGYVQRYFVFGGGFANDEVIMRYNRFYLWSMGHQGGVHNSYLSFWLDTGIVGLLTFLRSFFLLFFKASRLVPMSLAVMFSVLFSIMYESWLIGSLNPYTIVLLVIMTVVSEEEITDWATRVTEPDEEDQPEEDAARPALAAAN